MVLRLYAVFEILSPDWSRSSHDCLRFCTFSHTSRGAHHASAQLCEVLLRSLAFFGNHRRSVAFNGTQWRFKVKKVKVLWFSWKFGKMKKMHVWCHSHKVSGINLAYFCRYEALYLIGCYPKTYLKHLLYFYPIILNGYLKRSLILSIEKQPITHNQNNFWIHFHHLFTYMEVISCPLSLRHPYQTEVAHTNSMHQSISDSKPQVMSML